MSDENFESGSSANSHKSSGSKSDSNSEHRDNFRQRRLRRPRRKICTFCVEKVFDIDYKDINKLKKFVTDRAKIIPRRANGCCSIHQRRLTTAIKRARHLALMQFSVD